MSDQNHKRWLTLSNILTFLRIGISPLIAFIIFKRWWGVAFGLFVFASFTDLFDGYLARLLSEQTVLGTLLDPLADKFFLLCCFSSLAFFYSPSFCIPSWFFILILLREVILLIGSLLLIICTGSTLVIKPMWWGKLTTLFQLLFIGWIFICYFFSWAPAKTYLVLLFFLSLFSLITLLQYLKIGLHCLHKFKKH